MLRKYNAFFHYFFAAQVVGGAFCGTYISIYRSNIIAVEKLSMTIWKYESDIHCCLCNTGVKLWEM